MEYYIDASYKSLNKKDEELCGDKVEHIKTDDGSILVLSDGMGSGVKANILATLTSKIAVTMLKEGASIEDTIETIASTLPECSVRKMAYSTFTIIKINNLGECYMVEYDNPPCFLYRDGRDYQIIKRKRQVADKTILESNFILKPGDLLTVVSDGAVHAGVGESLNLGWEWENINDFLREISKKKFAGDIASDLLGICNVLYAERPGDDTTVLALKLQPVKKLTLFTGPPKEKSMDDEFVRMIEKTTGMIVLSGGTTANIVAKKWEKEIEIDLGDYTKDSVPPVGHLKGVDLVTEGLITLNKAAEYISEYIKNGTEFTKKDGAVTLAKLMVYEASHIDIVAGTIVNPAHQNPDFPIDFNIKLKVVMKLKNMLEKLGKKVTLKYI